MLGLARIIGEAPGRLPGVIIERHIHVTDVEQFDELGVG